MVILYNVYVTSELCIYVVVVKYTYCTDSSYFLLDNIVLLMKLHVLFVYYYVWLSY